MGACRNWFLTTKREYQDRLDISTLSAIRGHSLAITRQDEQANRETGMQKVLAVSGCPAIFPTKPIVVSAVGFLHGIAALLVGLVRFQRRTIPAGDKVNLRTSCSPLSLRSFYKGIAL